MNWMAKAAPSSSSLGYRTEKMKRYYGMVIQEGDDGSLQILAIGPEAIVEGAAWKWASSWVKRNKPEGTLRVSVWSEAQVAADLDS